MLRFTSAIFQSVTFLTAPKRKLLLISQLEFQGDFKLVYTRILIEHSVFFCKKGMINLFARFIKMQKKCIIK